MTKERLRHCDLVADIILERSYEKIVEIGVWEGWMVHGVLSSPANKIIKEYWAVDQWTILSDPDWRSWTEITQEEWDRKYFITCQLMCQFPQLKVVRMPSVKVATMFSESYFDFVYIDGDHRYDAVKSDIEAWLPLIKRGGMIAGHDYLYRSGKHRSPCGVKPAVDDYFEKDVLAKPFTVWVVER